MVDRKKRPLASILCFAGSILLGSALAAGCGGDSGAAGGGAGGGAAAQGQPAKPAAKSIRFEPATRDELKLAVGETLTERVVLLAEAPRDLRDVTLLASCECLAARFVEPPRATRGEVEVTWFGVTRESVDGVIFAEGPKHETLAEFLRPVTIERRAFVQPREVQIEKSAEGRFEIVVGQAFARDAKLPDSLIQELDASKLDETKIVLLDFDDVDPDHTDEDVILRSRLSFMVAEEARAKPFETEVPIEFGVPPERRNVKVRWPGR